MSLPFKNLAHSPCEYYTKKDVILSTFKHIYTAHIFSSINIYFIVDKISIEPLTIQGEHFKNVVKRVCVGGEGAWFPQLTL